VTVESTHPMIAGPGGAELQSLLGRYQLIYRIGTGGMADVFLARERSEAGLERWVAIKKMHRHLAVQSQFVQMLLDEARIAARIAHPNVAQTLEIGDGEGLPFLVMEYLHGEPLSHVIRRAIKMDGAPDMDLMARIVASACEGAHAAHELRGPGGEPLHLVHRDLSPQNVFVTYDGAVKVVDFGVAKAKGRNTMTEPGTLKGKFSYMSPEQARGQEIDRRSDVFALGSVLYKATTGLKPFGEESDLVILARVQKAQFLAPEKARRKYPPALATIVRKALAPNRDDRYATARDLGSAIEHYLMERRVVAGPSQIAAMMHRLFEQRIAERERLLAIESAPLTDLPGDSLADETAMSPVPETAQERSTSGISVRMVIDDASDQDRREARTVMQDTGSLVVGQPVRTLPVPWIVAGVAVALVLALFGAWAAFGGGDEPTTQQTPANVSSDEEDLLAAVAAPRSSGSAARTPAPTPPPIPPPLPDPGATATPPPAPDPGTATQASPDPNATATPDPNGPATPATPDRGTEPPPNHVRNPDRGPTKRVVSEGATGIVNIRSTPWSNVIVDGRTLRATPIVGYRLPAGSHTIRLVTSDGRTATRRVMISPGRTSLVDVRF